MTKNFSSPFARHLYNYALEIRTQPTPYNQKDMFAVSKKLLTVMREFATPEEIGQGLELAFS